MRVCAHWHLDVDTNYRYGEALRAFILAHTQATNASYSEWENTDMKCRYSWIHYSLTVFVKTELYPVTRNWLYFHLTVLTTRCKHVLLITRLETSIVILADRNYVRHQMKNKRRMNEELHTRMYFTLFGNSWETLSGEWIKALLKLLASRSHGRRVSKLSPVNCSLKIWMLFCFSTDSSRWRTTVLNKDFSSPEFKLQCD